MILNNSELEKHKKYNDYYNPNELYWGIGIENEVYLEFDKQIKISKDLFLTNHKRERYSVNYYKNYNEKYINNAFLHAYNNLTKIKEIDLPLFINSHSFLYTDSSNNSKRLYTKKNEENPDFNGTTLLEDILNFNSYFLTSYNIEWLFDGDTIEFTTLNFYNNTLNNCINELNLFKNNFITNIQDYQKQTNLFENYGLINIMKQNYPFTIHLTNLNNVGIFNNGTLHYNITLPTQLDENKLIKNKYLFINIHKKAIKIIQWLEPFIIAVYNTPDYFATINEYINKELFSNCSQRCAVSRYIGIGTYNSDLMLTGKILTTKTNNYTNYKNWWYTKFHQDSGYNLLEEIGLDINFNKHYNHGIEIRFIDNIYDDKLIIESFKFIILLMDYILESILEIENPINNDLWNNLVCNIIRYGSNYELNKEEIEYYQFLLDINITKINIKDVYYEIYNFLLNKYSKYSIFIGPFSKNVL